MTNARVRRGGEGGPLGSASLEHGTDDGPAQAVTKATATRYRSVSKGAKAKILDELRELTGWHSDHARARRCVRRSARGGRRRRGRLDHRCMARM